MTAARSCSEHGWPACMTRDGRCWVCALARAAGLDATGQPITLNKARYRLVATTTLYYHFLNLRTVGTLQREHYTIRRSEFWGSSR